MLSALDHLRRIYVEGAGGYRPPVPHRARALERAARRAMSKDAWGYLFGGAGLGATIDANRRDFDRWRIRPRMLEDVSGFDLSAEFFGAPVAAPIFLSPMGVMGLAHRDADLAVAEGAAALDLPVVISNQASHPMERIVERLGDTPHAFQLYWSREEALVRSLVRRAEACGARAIVLTLDTKMLGWRPYDLDRAFLPFLAAQGIAQYTSDPEFNRLLAEAVDDPDAPKPRLGPGTAKTLATMLRTHPGRVRDNLRTQAPIRAARLFTAIYSNPALGRDHIRRLREMTTLPIAIKGVLHPEDAGWAAEEGIAVYVSNHGGRQVDGAISAIAALPDVVEAVGGRVPVLFDSGVRGGADVAKALALGADAVGIGRPWGYGLAVAGAKGVEEVMRGIASETELTLRLCGLTQARNVPRDLLVEA